MRAVAHYTEAEKLLLLAGDADADPTEYLAAAQVHATLALAGATAMQAYCSGDSTELEDWEAAAGGDG